MPQLRSRLPSPLGPRRAGASRQRAPGPPGRVYKPPRPPASERASERGESSVRGGREAPRARAAFPRCVCAWPPRLSERGTEGNRGPRARLTACLPACPWLGERRLHRQPASQPASQPACFPSVCVCRESARQTGLPRSSPPEQRRVCGCGVGGLPSERAWMDGEGRKDRVSFHAGRRSSRSAPGRARERGAPAERPPLCPGGASPSRSRLLAFAPGREGGKEGKKEGRKEGRKEGAGWLRECGSVGDVTGSLTGLSSALACLPLGPRSIRERHDFISDT